jgi:hypothetical protein
MDLVWLLVQSVEAYLLVIDHMLPWAATLLPSGVQGHSDAPPDSLLSEWADATSR